MHLLKLYGRYITVYFKTLMEFKFSFFSSVFVQMFCYMVNYLTLWFVLNRFNSIHGWSLYQILFLYNLNMFSYAIIGLFFQHPMRSLEGMVQQGTFDSMLIYPLNPLLHMLFRHVSHGFIGNLLIGLAVFGMCWNKLNIIWTVTKVLWLLLVLIGAMLIHFGVMIIAGSMSFWIVRSNAVIDTTIYGLRYFLDYPITIYDRWVQIVLTFIIPYAFVNFYPAQYFLNKTEDYLFHPALQFATPIVGLVFLIIAYHLWELGIAKYQSTGS